MTVDFDPQVVSSNPTRIPIVILKFISCLISRIRCVHFILLRKKKNHNYMVPILKPKRFPTLDH